MVGVDAVERDMAEHDGGCRLSRLLAKRQPVVGQVGRRFVERCGAQMSVLANATEAREMFQRRMHAAVGQTGNIVVGDSADDMGIGGDGAGTDIGQSVFMKRAARAQVDHRAKVEIDAQPGQAGALCLAVVPGEQGEVAGFCQ